MFVLIKSVIQETHTSVVFEWENLFTRCEWVTLHARPDISVFYVHEANVVKSATELIKNIERKKTKNPYQASHIFGREGNP